MDEAMTTATDATRVFADARAMYDSALRQLDAADVRDAAEKARWAARRATDALILAGTGELPPKLPDATRALRQLAMDKPAVRSLRGRYFERQNVLHGDCFYTGLCEPIEDTGRLVRETIDYIQDAERLAGI